MRLVPLLQALLDANPALTATLVARRTYLYDNPRVTPVAISDDAAIHALLRNPSRACSSSSSQNGPISRSGSSSTPPSRRGSPRTRRRSSCKGTWAARSRGAPTSGRSSCTRGWSSTAGTSPGSAASMRPLEFPSSYDPGTPAPRRARAPPARGGGAARDPVAPDRGTARPMPSACWSGLLPGDGPVALVNPFGGSLPVKGFLRQETILAAELEGLVDEGYRVVVLPQDSEWARPAAIEAALVHLAADVRARVRVAPDPAEADVVARLALVERSALSSADRVMRLFKYFAAYADLVVTVEGWLAHLTYQLGRPFLLFLAAGSLHGRLAPHTAAAPPSDWCPRSRRAPPPPTRARPSSGRPTHPRCRTSLAEASSQGRPGRARASGRPGRPWHRYAAALSSPDPNVRTWAVAALGQIDAAMFKADLLAALGDHSAVRRVRGGRRAAPGLIDVGLRPGTRVGVPGTPPGLRGRRPPELGGRRSGRPPCDFPCSFAWPRTSPTTCSGARSSRFGGCWPSGCPRSQSLGSSLGSPGPVANGPRPDEAFGSRGEREVWPPIR